MYPQGACRIRKAAKPPTAAQQRMIGAEANRIAASNAATPRYGQCNRQALQLFELLACNANLSLGGSKGGYSLSRKRISPFKSPKRKVLDWQSQSRMTFLPPEWKCLRAALPRLELQDDLPLLLLSAAALPIL